jgi:hypothetical protein
MSDDNGSAEGEKRSARELTLAAREAIEELTGHKPESVTGMEWDTEAWDITVEVCELARVPNTTDVMATYVVRLDDTGRMLGYKRERRYSRGAVEQSG